MIELPSGADRLPLQLASRLLSAPGVWSPRSRLPLEGLGALVSAPLGWEWDGEAASWEDRAGSLWWAPPRRPLKRYLKRLRRVSQSLPRLLTLAPDTPKGIASALEMLAEEEHVAGYLLWAAMPERVAAARQVAPALPLLAEVPSPHAAYGAAGLVEAGADGLWLGPPIGRGAARLWGPAGFPLLLSALEAVAALDLGVPLIAGAHLASAEDAQRARDAGAAAVALDPAWWVNPQLAEEIAARL